MSKTPHPDSEKPTADPSAPPRKDDAAENTLSDAARLEVDALWSMLRRSPDTSDAQPPESDAD